MKRGGVSVRGLVLALVVLGAAAAPGAGQDAGPRTLTHPDVPLAVHYWPRQRRLADRLLESARRAPPLPALPDDVLGAGAPADVFLAPDPAAFDSLTGGGAPEWGAGIAIPSANRIVLPAYASDRVAPHELPRVLRHELAHLALHRYLESRVIPRWFDEGYARWAAGEWDWDAAWRLRLAFLLHDTPPLDSITFAWPRAEADAQAAYLLATSAVGYLLEHGGGTRGLALFLQRWKASGSLDAALRRTYGVTTGQLEEDWREDVKTSYGWTFLIADAAVFWAFAAVLLITLVVLRRRRDRTRLERLRATEPPDRPAFWLGEDGPAGAGGAWSGGTWSSGGVRGPSAAPGADGGGDARHEPPPERDRPDDADDAARDGGGGVG